MTVLLIQLIGDYPSICKSILFSMTLFRRSLKIIFLSVTVLINTQPLKQSEYNFFILYTCWRLSWPAFVGAFAGVPLPACLCRPAFAALSALHYILKHFSNLAGIAMTFKISPVYLGSGVKVFVK